MFNLEDPSELCSLCCSIAHCESEVSDGLIRAALQAITHAINARLPLMQRVTEAFENGVVGDDDVEADVEVVETVLHLRLLAMLLIRRLDGAEQVVQAFIYQSVDERVDPFAEALLMLELDDWEGLRYHDLEPWDLDHDRWWGRFFSPQWRKLGHQLEEICDELAADCAIERMVDAGASEVKARWCLELAEEALDWRYWRNLGRRQPDYLFENRTCDDDRAVWIENGARVLERAVRSLAERMAATRTETLKRFAEFLGSQRTPSVEIPEGL